MMMKIRRNTIGHQFLSLEKSYLRVNYRKINLDGFVVIEFKAILGSLFAILNPNAMIVTWMTSPWLWPLTLSGEITFRDSGEVNNSTRRRSNLTIAHSFRSRFWTIAFSLSEYSKMDTPTPTPTPTKKRKTRTALTLAERIKVIERKEKGESTKSLAADYGTGLTQIVNICAKKRKKISLS